MSKRIRKANQKVQVTVKRSDEARAIKIAEAGLTTADDLMSFMAALVADIVTKRLSSSVGNVAVAASSQMVKLLRLRHQLCGEDGSPPKLLGE